MSTARPMFWGQKTFCLITGASQGIGRQFAIEFSRNVGTNSVFVLLARSEQGLADTKDLVVKTNQTVNVKTAMVDLCNPDSDVFSIIINSSLVEFDVKPTSFDLVMIVHNAGSVGDVSEKSSQMSNPQKWVDYLSLNLISTICLNSIFLDIFSEGICEKCIINITSLCGIQPYKSMAYYCVGKSSREMFFRVLASENPSFNVLSYSPGPVDTDMIANVTENIADEGVKAIFVSIKSSGKILTPEQTTRRCVQILSERKYKSGDHIDYFDKNY